MILTMAVLTVPLLVVGWFYYWWPFFVGLAFALYAGYGLYERCTQRTMAEADMAAIQALLAPQVPADVEL
jgi:hypothetical protein